MFAGDLDFSEGGWLDGLDGDRRSQRIELLEWLAQQGFSETEMRWAHDHGVLQFLAADREIGGPRLYTQAQIAELSGIEAPFTARLRRAQGLPAPSSPDEVAFSELDLRVATELHQWLEGGFEPEQVISSTRAIGGNLARAAEAMRAALFDLVVAPGATEREIAAGYAQATAALLPLSDDLIRNLTRQHLRNIMQSEIAGAIEFASGRSTGGQELAVAFADLVGFTRLGEEVAPEALGRVAERLVEIVQDLLTEDVRMVKTIGDAVLLTSHDPAALVDFGLRLCARVAEPDGDAPQLRVGIASGPVVSRSGDVFGGPVNVANRVTAVARTGSVLTTVSVRDAASERFAFSPVGVRRLKGLPRPIPLFRARPPVEQRKVTG
ncbi:MAG: adenylate cyclase regulatory domain-containing protein [Baekduia sp.]